MHRHILIALAGAALLTSGCVTRPSAAVQLRLQAMESRLDALEKNVSSGGSKGGDVVFNLYQDVQALKEKVRQLRGEIQELQHKMKQKAQRQRDLYKNLNKRLLVVERRLGIAAGGGAATGLEAGIPVSPGGDKAGAEDAYMAAFNLLTSGKYAQARKRLKAFVQKYPHSKYTDNAWYWLGEARYVDRRYDRAQAAFRHVIEDFPASPKVPGAIYKMGVILDELGKLQQARKTLKRLVEQYPESSAADLARKRLKAMRGE